MSVEVPASLIGSPGPDTGEGMITEALVTRGKLRRADLARLGHVYKGPGNGDSLPLLLSKLGLVSEHDVADVIAEILPCRRVNAGDYPNAPILEEALSYRFLKQHRVIPLEESADRIVLAVADPLNVYAGESVGLAAGRAAEVCVGTPSEIDAALDRVYGDGKSEMGRMRDRAAGVGEVTEAEVEQLKDLASEAPVIRMVNLIMQRALEEGASDIHVEPAEGTLRVRCRVDGVLHETEAPAANLAAAVISRIKIMANLDIAERRLPQDGRIRLRIQGQDLDFRVSTVPTMHGESVVLRILNREAIPLDFAALGIEEDDRRRLQEILKRPHGLLLVTGPTGSGKTTSLYAALSVLNRTEVKIITVEDPVEYQIDGVNQIQVKPSIGLDFAHALRSIVRQDPDVIMVGEMRDTETARICVQSALTGHLVLSTLHTNDAASSITRLLDMGVEDYLITSTVNAVLGQRLVRRLCEHCKAPMETSPELQRRLTTRAEAGPPWQLFSAVGCDACHGSGYRGRTVIMELMPLDDRLRRLVMNRADASQLHECAVESGMRTLYDDGLRKVRQGVTTLDEVMRVTQET